MDIIFLSEVKVQTHLGVPDWERLTAQTIVLDIEIAMPDSGSCQTDDITDTIDYGVVVARIRETLAERSFKLVEALAEHICQLILQEFNSPWVKIKVAKPGILPGLKALGVVIERGRKTD
ncbi:dihydroneopterin aldolase [Methylobacillus rhizosphaerae]|uniref:7,8-dihydroneopterin aldolase n=1 Tax=Methylobacillus rhizosphaerae TaxID=551994 RepID=A0A238XWE4_9PROT|nr:dihydroneopterin aldolase [Methylobacillus rhizosphaerae]SNR62888.1 dihydroneopterin aldolase [Methylobacillus rhizosphaerae]